MKNSFKTVTKVSWISRASPSTCATIKLIYFIGRIILIQPNFCESFHKDSHHILEHMWKIYNNIPSIMMGKKVSKVYMKSG